MLRIHILLSMVLLLTGCNTIGMLLFYREIRTTTIYKSPGSKKNYYTISAVTLSHCGCTDLDVHHYTNRKKDFYITYKNDLARKTIYRYNKQTFRTDTIRLQATTGDKYTIPFDSLDAAIFHTIDSLLLQSPKPKHIVYPPKRVSYKGYVLYAGW